MLENAEFGKAERVLLRDQVANRLRQLILTGQLAPGERLVELRIAKHMHTSQGPVREAMQRLAEEGLIRTVQHKGSFVAPLSVEDMRDIFALRRQVESYTARKAAESADAAWLATLERRVAAMQSAAAEGAIARLIEHDMAFHQAVCERAGNPVFTQVWRLLDGQVRRFIHNTHPHYFADLTEIAATHTLLLDALASGRPELAEQRFSDHISLIWTRIDGAPQPTGESPA